MHRRTVTVLSALAVTALAGTGTAQAAPGFDPSASSSRAAGVDRYDTAARVALQAWAGETGGTVIVVNGETTGVDALSAAYLAGYREAPVLLTRRDGVPAPTAAAIAQLNPSRVVVIGAEASVSAGTYAQLTAGRTGERIAGTDRYETAATIARTAAGLPPGEPVPIVFLVRGDKPGVAADALAAAPISYRGHWPILLTGPGRLPDATRMALGVLQPTTLIVLGDYDSIDASLISQAEGAAGGYRQGHVPGTNRYAGRDRSETAALLANSPFASGAGLGVTAVGIANGTTVDALAAGPAAGKGGYPVLLTPGRDDAGSGTRAYVAEHEATLTSAVVYGDQRSISDAAMTSLRPAAPS